jgi:hypothetical protein
MIVVVLGVSFGKVTFTNDWQVENIDDNVIVADDFHLDILALLNE